MNNSSIESKWDIFDLEKIVQEAEYKSNLLGIEGNENITPFPIITDDPVELFCPEQKFDKVVDFIKNYE